MISTQYSVLEFFILNADAKEFAGKDVLEVGSKYVNGSVRPFIERFLRPKTYIGVDIEPGRYVDLIVSADKLVEHFGENIFDVVIATELLEHVENWRAVIDNVKRVLKPSGYLYITTCSLGFQYHGFPHDFWRYEIGDMKKIFLDFEIIGIQKDPGSPSVFLKARKLGDLRSVQTSDISLYSVILGKRTMKTPKFRDMPIPRKIRFKITMIGSRPFHFVLRRFGAG